MLKFRHLLAAAAAGGLQGAVAHAEPLKIEAVMTSKEKIQLDFADGSKHFVLMVRREGEATGTGLLNGTKVVEYGVHDITPGVGGEPRGYLVLTSANGDIAYVKWQVIKTRHSAVLMEQLGRTHRSVEFKHQNISAVSSGSTRSRISLSVMAARKVTLPPVSEQCDIVKLVARKAVGFDNLINEAETGIALLQERRSALISAAVTGKIDVRGAAALAAEAA